MSDPYAAPESDVNLAPSERSYEYVGFWARVVASLIDSILMVFVLVPVLVAFGYEDTSPLVDLFNFLFPIIAVMMFWYYRSTTPGKMIFNAVIIDAQTGDKLTKGQILIRYLGYYVSLIPLCLGMIWVGFDRKKQGWHDKMAGTVVVRYTNELEKQNPQEVERQE